MALEIILDGKSSELEMISKKDNLYRITIDKKVYEIDLVKVDKGIYSAIFNNKSYNLEITPGNKTKTYRVDSDGNSYDLEILDAEAKYIKSRKQDDLDDDDFIFSPMPGKVVKILVKKGDKVKAGDTVVIVSAMKMESEYKVKKDRLIKDVVVKEGDTIDGNQPLIIIE